MLIFWIATISLAAFSFSKGDPYKLAQTYDLDHTPCGSEPDGTLDFPMAYFYQPLKSFNQIVCVKQCPQWGLNEARLTEVSCFGQGTNFKTDIGACSSTKEFEFGKLPSEFITFYPESFLIYNSTDIVGRFCIPSYENITDTAVLWLKNITAAAQLDGKFQEYFSDIKETQNYLMIVGAIAFVISIVTLFLIRYCAGIFVWLILLLYLIGVFLMAVLCQRESQKLEQIAIEQ